jgi:hypothetical protein
MPKPVIESVYKVRVGDVFNDTHKVYDVDVIGGLWNGIEDALRKRGMLWAPQNEGEPYTLESHITLFKKGDMIERITMPRVGDTVLEVRTELRQGGRHLATIESKKSFKYLRGSWTRSAWKKAFEAVSEEIVAETIKRF